MADVLIRDVPEAVLAGVDGHASRLGLSRVEYIRRRLASDAATSDGVSRFSASSIRGFICFVGSSEVPARESGRGSVSTRTPLPPTLGERKPRHPCGTSPNRTNDATTSWQIQRKVATVTGFADAENAALS